MTPASVGALRRFIRPRRVEGEERCDLCGEAIGKQHEHNFDPATRRIRCTCAYCAVIVATVYKRVPRRVVPLENFEMTDAVWDGLMIPISLAFFTHDTAAQKVVALYPGPAGATESLLRMDAWDEICANNPELDGLEPDVEALLVNRVGCAREYFIVPIDECYKLVGLIRLHWKGLSGGSVVWGEIGQFFEQLRRRGAE